MILYPDGRTMRAEVPLLPHYLTGRLVRPRAPMQGILSHASDRPTLEMQVNVRHFCAGERSSRMICLPGKLARYPDFGPGINAESMRCSGWSAVTSPPAPAFTSRQPLSRRNSGSCLAGKVLSRMSRYPSPGNHVYLHAHTRHVEACTGWFSISSNLEVLFSLPSSQRRRLFRAPKNKFPKSNVCRQSHRAWKYGRLRLDYLALPVAINVDCPYAMEANPATNVRSRKLKP